MLTVDMETTVEAGKVVVQVDRGQVCEHLVSIESSIWGKGTIASKPCRFIRHAYVLDLHPC